MNTLPAQKSITNSSILEEDRTVHHTSMIINRSIMTMPPLVFALRNASSITNKASTKHPLTWLDLRGLGLSALERLSLEELLLRHDPQNRCWGIIGCHEPIDNRLLNVASSSSSGWNTNRSNHQDSYGHDVNDSNKSCAIILGIGGKIDRLVNTSAAKRDGILILRRFSGGGTVVVDHNSLWTTFIGRNDAIMSSCGGCVKPFPREIMTWSADTVFGPAFRNWNGQILDARKKLIGKKRGRQTLVFHGKSCGVSGGVGESLILPNTDEMQTCHDDNITIPAFQLRENDYILGKRKMGGNAQSIVSTGFLHHTSFLWDYDQSNMDYLTLPEKRPEYRGDRSHDDFLVKLKEYYGNDSTKSDFFDQVKTAAGRTFDLEDCTLKDALSIANDKFGSFQKWFDGPCRTKIEKLQ
jgi:lipoate-protein ligase A